MEKGQSSRPADCGGFTIASQHAYFERWLLLLEKRYDEKFDAMADATSTALTAVEKQTAAAFAANKESVIKTEDAQKAYNLQHNDLTRKMEVQAEKFVHREKMDDVSKAFDAKLESLKKDIDALQQSRAAIVGGKEERTEQRQTMQWGIGHAITLAVVLAGLIVGLIEALLRSRP